MNKYEVLKHYFGYEQFRQGQQVLIDHILDGKDVVGIMPTGAGKSICFQVPALLFQGMTLVISPLISLMKDQVQALTQSGVAAAYLNGSLSWHEVQNVIQLGLNGQIKILYVAPERLLDPMFLSFVQQVEISFLAIDEAHCVSQWGQDFRPSYLKIMQFIAQLSTRPILGAFTATATKEVKADIIEILQLDEPKVVTTGFDRENLYFEVRKPKDKFLYTRLYVENHENESGIIYCATRKNVDDLYLRFQALGKKVTKYHAGLTAEERKNNQDAFLFDQKPIMIATNAFGMGIDKSNVSYVIHYNMPKNIESYYQEAGRAGRGGDAGRCIILYSGQDVRTNQYFIDNPRENDMLDSKMLKEVIEKDKERLKWMTFYCHTNDCLRGYILKYFGEKGMHYCGNCSNCKKNYDTEDRTIEAQKVLSCIKRARDHTEPLTIVHCLLGKQTIAVEEKKLHLLSTFGLLQDSTEKALNQLIRQLCEAKYLCMVESVDGEKRLQLTEKAIRFLLQKESFYMPIKKKEVTEDVDEEKIVEAAPVVHQKLFEQLKAIRSELAREQKVPAFVIFSDASLRDMCVKLPKSEKEFLQVSGVGQMKLDRYGQVFLPILKRYSSQQS